MQRFYRYHTTLEQRTFRANPALAANQQNNPVLQKTPYLTILKQIWVQIYNVFVTFFVTLAVFPAVHSGKSIVRFACIKLRRPNQSETQIVVFALITWILSIFWPARSDSTPTIVTPFYLCKLLDSQFNFKLIAQFDVHSSKCRNVHMYIKLRDVGKKVKHSALLLSSPHLQLLACWRMVSGV